MFCHALSDSLAASLTALARTPVPAAPPLLQPPHARPRPRLSRCCCCAPPPRAQTPLNYCIPPPHHLGCSSPGAHTYSPHARAPPPCAHPPHHYPLSAPLCCGRTVVNVYQPVASSGASSVALIWLAP